MKFLILKTKNSPPKAPACPVGRDQPRAEKLKTNKGFTVIELMIVIAVTVVLLTITISFSRNSTQGIVIINERSRLVAAITRAKAASIQTLSASGSPACGYGIWFDPIPGNPGFIFFRDTPVFPETECIRSGSNYTGDMVLGPGEEIDRGEFDGEVIYKNLPVTEVLFIPPDPKTVIFPGMPDEAIITISTADNGAEAAIKITSAGLITTL